MKRCLLILFLLAGCDQTNGWKARDFCVEVYDNINADPNRERLYPEQLRAMEILGRDEYVDRCIAATKDAVASCSEYRLGSDRGIDCTQRRIYPAMWSYAREMHLLGRR